MEKIRLRQFKEGDEEAIFYLHIEGLKQTDSYIDNPVARKHDQDLKNIRETYTNRGGDFIVATIDNQIAGIGALKQVDTTIAEVKRMRVRTEFQGQGIGKLILDKLIDRAKELGYKRLVLDTSEKQIVAQKLYESRGFAECKRGEICGQKTIWYQLDI